MSSGTWVGVGTSPDVVSHSQSHPRYLRLNFGEDMNNDSFLVDEANYTIAGLTTVSVTRVDADTVDIVFDGPIPEGNTTITIVGPRDLALNAMNGAYGFIAIENFLIRSVRWFGDRSFVAVFSRVPYSEDMSIRSVLLTGNWNVELNGKKIQVTEIEQVSGDTRSYIIHVANVVFDYLTYDIIASPYILDEDLLDSLTELEHESVGHISIPTEQFEIVSGVKTVGLPQKIPQRHSSTLIRKTGTGYVLRNNETTLVRNIVRMIFSKFYYHIDKKMLLGLTVKGKVSSKLEPIRASIIKIAKMHKDVVDASCSLKYTQQYELLEISLTIYTKTGQSIVGLSVTGDGGVNYA